MGPAQLSEGDIIVFSLDLVDTVLDIYPEIGVVRRSHVKCVVSQTTSHESDLPASPLLVERARSHVVLEVEDESLH